MLGANAWPNAWRNTLSSGVNTAAIENDANIATGNSVAAAYSQDGGKSFHAAPDPVEFNPPLAARVYAGVAISPTDAYTTSEIRFRGLQIRKR